MSLCLAQAETLECENVTLALDYKFYWKGTGITSISLTRTVGKVLLNGSCKFTQCPNFFLIQLTFLCVGLTDFTVLSSKQ